MKDHEPRHDQSQSQRERGTDYSAMFRFVRADQDVGSFVDDLRDNKKHLRTLMREIFDEGRGKSREEQGARGLVVRYLYAVLEQHIFGSDPYRYSPDIGVIQRSKELDGFYVTRKLASGWIEDHPSSEAAKAVSLLGLYAPPESQHKLLQEMWPTLLPVLTAWP